MELANLYDMNVIALVNSEVGGGQATDEDKINAITQQIKDYDEAIAEARELVLKLIKASISDYFGVPSRADVGQ